MTDTLESLVKLFELLPDAVVVVDKRGNILLASNAISAILGYEPAELVGQPLSCLIPERYREGHHQLVSEFHGSGRAGPMSTRPLLPALAKNGEERYVSIAIGSIPLNEDKVSVAVIRDAKPLHQTLEGALNQARRDPLTGMFNRLDFSVRLEEAIRHNQPFALLYLDLQNFKPFNDQYGHQVGDEVLRIIANRIGMFARSEDVAARLGGDEFAMMFLGLTGHHLLRERAVHVANSVSAPFDIGAIKGAVGVNIGAAFYPQDGRCEQALLGAADRRMYRAKQRGESLWLDVEAMTDPGARLDWDETN